MNATTARAANVKVDLQLLGKPYSVACEAGEEKRLEALAGYLDAKLRTLAGSISSANESRLFMLAALMLADEVFELKAAQNSAVHTPAVTNQPENAYSTTYLAAIQHLTARLQKVTARLQGA